jgi:hypothetical protein
VAAIFGALDGQEFRSSLEMLGSSDAVRRRSG